MSRVCWLCDEGEVSDHSRSGVCSPCQSSFQYWKSKSPARVMRRRGQLKKYNARLDHWFDKKGNKGAKNAQGSRRPANRTLN